eukprot:scaffold22639_cov105-Cylindrotheca_fusiformis.AAC.6
MPQRDDDPDPDVVTISSSQVDDRYNHELSEDIGYSTTALWRKRAFEWRKRIAIEIEEFVASPTISTNDPIPSLKRSTLGFCPKHPVFETSISTLRRELEEYRQLRDESTLENQIQPLQAAIQGFESDKQSLQNDMQALQDEIQALQDEIQTLQAERQTLQNQIQSLPSRIRSLQSRLEANPEESNLAFLIDATQGWIEEKRGRIEDKQRSINATQRSINATQGRIEDKQRSINVAQQQIEDKQRSIEAAQRQIKKDIEDKQVDITKSIILIAKDLNSVAEAHALVRSNLDILKERGNENAATSVSKPTVGTDKDRIDPTKVSSPPQIRELINISEDRKLENELIAASDKVPSLQRNLSKFQDFLSSIIKHAPEYKERLAGCIAQTVQIILTWEPDSTNEKIEFHQLVRPSFQTDNENTVDQPILRAILLRIIRMIDHNNLTLTSEQHVPILGTGEGTRGRRSDEVACKTQEYLSSLFPAMLGRAIEMKAVSVTELENRLLKGENQVLGHLGKQAWFSFDFGGVGEDCVVYGICLTIWSVSVEKLALEGVGTDEVRVETKRTSRLRLLGKDYSLPDKVGSLLTDGKKGHALAVLAGALMAACPPPGKAALTTGKSQLVEKTGNSDAPQELEIERLLGSGAFSNVLKLKGDGKFLKIPKAAALVQSIKREAQVLSVINADGSREDIPQLVRKEVDKLSMLKLVTEFDEGSFTGLKLKGIVGRTLLSVQASTSDKRKTLGSLILGVFDALEYAHKQGYVHLDIRPENIIVDSLNEKIMVSDWGAASKLGERIMFRGCLPYAHDRWFVNRTSAQKVEAKFDFASLLYTWVHVAENGLSWNDDFQRLSTVHIDAIDKRREACNKAVLGDDTYRRAIQEAAHDDDARANAVFGALITGSHLRCRRSPRLRATSQQDNQAQHDQMDEKRPNGSRKRTRGGSLQQNGAEQDQSETKTSTSLRKQNKRRRFGTERTRRGT